MRRSINNQQPRLIRAKQGWGLPSFKELWQFRDLFFLLAERDIKLKYKQTAIGIAWVVLQPLATALLFSLIFGYFARFTAPGSPYLLFAFAGMLSWLLFSQIVQRASSSLLNDAKLISKVYFPRVAIPLASAFAVLLDFFVALAVMLLLMVGYGVPLSWNIALLAPLLVCEILFAAGLASFLAAWNVHYRDFVHVIPFMLQLWMYATPLFYPISLIPESWQTLFSLNPLVGFAEGFRYALLGTGDLPLYPMISAALISIAVFFFGMLFFERLERTFADVV